MTEARVMEGGNLVIGSQSETASIGASAPRVLIVGVLETRARAHGTFSYLPVLLVTISSSYESNSKR